MRLSDRRGTSLLELSIVVMVIGILCVTAFEYYKGERDNVRIKVTEAKVSQIQAAFRQYYVENGQFPRSMGELRGKYIAQLPVRNAWGDPIELVYGDIPRIHYNIYKSGARVKIEKEVLDPWKLDVKTGVTLQQMFDQKKPTAKIMLGKTVIKPHVINQETEGTDLMGRTVYNEFFGDYVFDASIEVICKTPDDPETTPTDPGHDIRVSFSGGEIYSLTSNNPLAEINFLGSEFTASSSVQLVKYSIDLRDCPFLTTFNFEIFAPGTPGLTLYYGQHEIMTMPPCDLYDNNEAGTDPIWLRKFSPVSIERSLHEDTRYVH